MRGIPAGTGAAQCGPHVPSQASGAAGRTERNMTINGTAAILLAFYVAAAEKKGVPREKLTGTI